MHSPRRCKSVGAWRTLALIASLAVAAGSARAAEPPVAPDASRTRSISVRDAAVLLMQAGRLAEARRALESLERANPKDNDVQFLLGMVAMQEKAYPEAIRRFRAVLARQPKAERVRLELARAFFLQKDYDNAERQFRFARAGDLPAAAMTNIDKYLFAIRQSRIWSYNLTVALAPDSNMNAGPALNAVDIYGLPFQLSSDAKRRGGVGESLGAGGEWSPPLTSTMRLRIGGQFDGIAYPDRTFNDMTLGVYAGPRIVLRRWDVSALVTGFERWYGDSFYNRGFGGSVQATFYVAPRLGLTGSVAAQAVTYRPPTSQGGPATSGSFGYFYTLSPLSVTSGGVSISRQDAGLAAYANTATQVQIAYYRDLPGGFSASIQPAYAWVDYDGPMAAFGVARRDRQWSVKATLLDRRIDIGGFTPKLQYIHTDNASDIELYRYQRDQALIGLTRSF